MSDRLTVLGFRAAWFVLPRIPHVLARRAFDVIADVAWLRNGKGVRRLQANVARVTGVTDAQTQRDQCRRAMRSYCRYWAEMFSIDRWTAEQIEQRVRFVDRHHLDNAMASGTGAVIAATHSGNWDLVGVHVAQTWGGGTTVGERLKPEALFDAFTAAREKYGIEILPHVGGPRPAFAVLLERLRAGRLVALVTDRDLSSRGIEVDFLGGRARMAAGPAALAKATGAAIIPTSLWFDEHTAVCEFRPPLPVMADDTVETITQRLADVYAEFISAHPLDWHMLQRIWVDGVSA